MGLQTISVSLKFKGGGLGKFLTRPHSKALSGIFFLVVVSLGAAVLVLILVVLLVYAHCLHEREKKDYKQ